MNILKNLPITEFTQKLIDAEHIFNEIYSACDKTFWRGCGSYLFNGQDYAYDISMLPKQELLYNLVKNKNSILEIGTYMGHSLLIVLLANPEIKITSIDIDDKYTKPALTILKKYFPSAEIEFLKGNSLDILPTIKHKTYDIFHIDGQHADSHIQYEVEYCINLTTDKKITKIIFDDVDCCLNVVENIKSKYKILSCIKPYSAYTNMYLEFAV